MTVTIEQCHVGAQVVVSVIDSEIMARYEVMQQMSQEGKLLGRRNGPVRQHCSAVTRCCAHAILRGATQRARFAPLQGRTECLLPPAPFYVLLRAGG